MAPEQLEGGEIDARTDIWALGCVLYEMLTGRKAFKGQSQASLIGAILEREPAPMASGQPPALDRTLRRCLAKEPHGRWDTAHELRNELQRIAEGGGLAGVVAMHEQGTLAPQRREEALRHTRLWRDAPEDALATAASLVTPRRFEDGDVLIEQGAEVAQLHVLTAGTVDVRVRIEDGTVVDVATLGAGECVGEMSLLTGDPASADVVARGDVTTLALDARDFRSVAASNPDLLRQVVRILARRLARTDVSVGHARNKERELTQFLHSQKEWERDMVGESPAVRRLRREVAAVAPKDVPVVVQGETGTGKELVARMIHDRSARAKALVIATDCADISDNAWGNKLFGASASRSAPGEAISYMDLAEGGTIILLNIELLPMSVQELVVRYLAARAEDPATVRDARLIATTGEHLNALAAGGRMAPELARLFGGEVLRVPPLRDRKRDIRVLAEHYLRQHAERLGKPAERFDDEALTTLVSYDYSYANDQELEGAIRRAVILQDGDTISAEEIFLGPTAQPRPGGIDLLPSTHMRRWVRAVPGALQAFMFGALILLLLLAFLGPQDPASNPTALIVWTIGWPLLALSYFFVGRLACAVCPLGYAGALVQRIRSANRRVPGWLKKHGVHLAMAGFFLIVLAEEGTAMRQSPALTGTLLLAIVAAAGVTSVLYPRRTWCRHLCPLGAMAGVCATTGILELRPTPDVCTATCEGHDCFKGTEHVPGCPMFNHVMFIDSNQHCILCMNCVAACPNDSPQLRLRVPGREIWDGTTSTPQFGWFVLLLAGLLLSMTVVQHVDRTGSGVAADLLADHSLLFVAVVLGIGALLPAPVQAYARLRLRGSDDDTIGHFWRRAAALTPWSPPASSLISSRTRSGWRAFAPRSETRAATEASRSRYWRRCSSCSSLPGCSARR